MNLAVIGSGGREHAICYKLKQSSRIKEPCANLPSKVTAKLEVVINKSIIIKKNLIFCLILHIFVELLLEKSKPLVIQRSNTLVDREEYFSLKLHISQNHPS